MPLVSVIIPGIFDKDKFRRFYNSLFACELEIELLVCGVSNDNIINDSEYIGKCVFIDSGNMSESLNSALSVVKGKFLMISDENVVFSPGAIEKMIVLSSGNSAVCNVGIIKDSGCKKAFREHFTVEDVSSKPIWFNHLLSADIIKNNGISLYCSDSLSKMLLIADYNRYESCVPIDEVLLYTDSDVYEYSFNESMKYITEYADVFSRTCNANADLLFLNAVFTALIPCLNEETYSVLKSAISYYNKSEAILAWIRSSFGIDTVLLSDENSTYDEFKYNGRNVYYKEVVLPMNPDSVVRYFYAGKFGLDMVKKCMGAWLHYKFYCRKNGFIKKIGCKLSRKLLGGDFVG